MHPVGISRRHPQVNDARAKVLQEHERPEITVARDEQAMLVPGSLE